VFSRISRSIAARGGLWANADFMRLWGAQSVSIFGTYITIIAFPLLAATTLDASAFEMGVLSAAGSLPFLLIGLFVGVWVDRVRKRPLLIAADLARAALLLIVPLASVLDFLSFELLAIIAFVHGALSVIFDVADTSYLPSVVERSDLVDANGRLELSASVAQISGPALAGGLVAILTAPFAVLADAFSFLASATILRKIKHVEPEPVVEAHEPWRVQITSGFRTIAASPVLRAIVGTTGATAFFGEIFMAIYVFYLAESLDLGSFAIGVIFATGGIGALLGATLSGPIARRIGAGNTIVLGQLMFGITGMTVPLAVLVPDYAVPLIIASEFLQWGFLILRHVNAASMRQAFTPANALGRVQSTALLTTRGSQPIGALIGGALATVIGAPLTLALAEVGMLLAVIPLLTAPIRAVRTLNDAGDGDAPHEPPMVETAALSGTALG
jgi:MFS family permease